MTKMNQKKLKWPQLQKVNILLQLFY